MPVLRPTTYAPVIFLLIVALYWLHIVHSPTVRDLTTTQHPHNLAYESEEAIDELIWENDYKGRDYYSNSANIYDKDVLSKLMQPDESDGAAKQASWAKVKIEEAEAESVAAWREARDRERQKEMAKLGQAGGQIMFKAFDPLAKNPIKNPLQAYIDQKKSASTISDSSPSGVTKATATRSADRSSAEVHVP